MRAEIMWKSGSAFPRDQDDQNIMVVTDALVGDEDVEAERKGTR